MKLYGLGFCYTDGRFRLCGHMKNQVTSTCVGVVENVIGQDDKISLARLLKMKIRVYCTPRCHETRSWEVGLVHDYFVRFLVGSTRITSFDYHILQSMEIIQVFFHALEIQEQSGPQLTLYGALCDISEKPAAPGKLQKELKSVDNHLLEKLVRLKFKLKEYLCSLETKISATDLIQDLEQIRDMYFDGLHLCLLSRHGLNQKNFLRQLGRLHGLVRRRILKSKLVLRRYYRNGEYFEQVREKRSIHFTESLFRRMNYFPELRLFHFILHCLLKLVWKLKFLI